MIRLDHQRSRATKFPSSQRHYFNKRIGQDNLALNDLSNSMPSCVTALPWGRSACMGGGVDAKAALRSISASCGWPPTASIPITPH